MNQSKTCTKCNQTLLLDNFSRHNGKKSSATGYRPTCKKCDVAYNREYRARNRKKVNARKSEWARNNRHRMRDAEQRYREKNRERLREYHREWREQNPDIVKAQKAAWLEKNHERKKQLDREYGKANRAKNNLATRKYRERNPEKIKQFERNWRLANPQKVLLQSHKRRALKNQNGVFLVTKKDVKKLMQQNCVYCGSPAEHLDHVIPIARGGKHSIGNLAPACAFCNMSKGAKLVSEWKHWRNSVAAQTN